MLPPLLSQPGCSDGILPYETEEAEATATGALNGLLEQLKIELTQDMMGNGPGAANWGLMNMILSDTMGYPYTAHTRKVGGVGRWVDFYQDPDIDVEEEEDKGNGKIPKYKRQRGAFPYKVAAWLEDWLNDEHAYTTTFASNNEKQPTTELDPVSFDTANFSKFNGNFKTTTITRSRL